MAVRTLCLCDGYGGFELGLRLAGVDVRTVARVERDSHAAATLVARMDEATLDSAPVWGDLETFDGTAWRGRVDLITAGFPCQPFSAAGQRKGLDDDRWLWPDIERIIRDVRPSCVFLENVPGLVGAGLLPVLEGLANLGFDAEWGLLSAAAAGAPHKRERFWLLAVAHHHHDGLGWLWREPAHDRDTRHDADGPSGSDVADRDQCGRKSTVRHDGSRQSDVGRRCPDVGNPGGPRRPEVTRSTPGDEGADGRWAQGDHITDGSGEDVADSKGVGEREPHHQIGSESRQRSRPNAGGGSERLWPPRPDDAFGWEQWIAEGGPEPSVRRSTDGRPVGLAESLHLGGNGLVPQVAGRAFVQLAARFKGAS